MLSIPLTYDVVARISELCLFDVYTFDGKAHG